MRSHNKPRTEEVEDFVTTFDGLFAPRYTPVPDVIFDRWLALLEGSELRVLLYIVRRTMGFNRKSDRISLQQICDGIRTKDGKRLDWGTGLGKSTVARALRSLEEKQRVRRHQKRDPQKGDLPTSYALNLISPVSRQADTPLSHERDTPCPVGETHKKQSSEKQGKRLSLSWTIDEQRSVAKTLVKGE